MNLNSILSTFPQPLLQSENSARGEEARRPGVSPTYNPPLKEPHRVQGSSVRTTPRRSWLCWYLTLKCTDTLCLQFHCLSLASHPSNCVPSISNPWFSCLLPHSHFGPKPEEPGEAIPKGRDACRTRPGLPGPGPSPRPSRSPVGLHVTRVPR